ncbi:MAG: lipid-A-disaccharide synthase [Acidobacteria bacterium]|nr:lipid-A-disaccharide synthase [Acidobacteriota bacterium]
MPAAARLFLVCTETSGDLLGSRLVASLQEHIPNLLVRGVAGPRLEQLGMQAVYRVSDFNVMGLVEVLSELGRLKHQFNVLVQDLKQFKPDAIVLIDAPDFNLRFAKAIHGLGIPVIYYVSPQVWAWRPGRAKTLAQITDHMLVLFPFECEIYRPLGLKTTFVGHPLVEEIAQFQPDPAFDQQYPTTDKPLVVLAPGSRKSEIERLLPTMAEVARRAADRYDFRVPLVPSFPLEQAQALVGNAPITFCPGGFRELMARADAAVVASGTATLETGLFGVPMVVGYRLNRLTHFMAKRLVKVPHVGMVNLILGERVMPELIQNEFTPERILAELEKLMQPGPVRDRVLEKLNDLPQALGGLGASDRAARAVLTDMGP